MFPETKLKLLLLGGFRARLMDQLGGDSHQNLEGPLGGRVQSLAAKDAEPLAGAALGKFQ